VINACYIAFNSILPAVYLHLAGGTAAGVEVWSRIPGSWQVKKLNFQGKEQGMLLKEKSHLQVEVAFTRGL
jgi:hypothetical protein